MKTRKGISQILIIIIVAVFSISLAGGGVWYWQSQKIKKQAAENKAKLEELQKKSEEQKPKETKEETPTPTPTPPPTTSPTSEAVGEVIPDYAKDWYKFISPNYGFTFRYPKTGIDVSLPSQPVMACNYPLNVNDEREGNDYLKQNFSAAWIYGEFFALLVTPANLTIAEYIKKQDPDGYRSYKVINISRAKEAVKIDPLTTRPYEGYPPLSYTRYIINDGKNLYEVHSFQNAGFSGDCSPRNFTETLDQIIGTFNFY